MAQLHREGQDLLRIILVQVCPADLLMINFYTSKFILAVYTFGDSSSSPDSPHFTLLRSYRKLDPELVGIRLRSTM